MTISLKHAFQSGKADGSDATLVQPSNWNEEHELTMATARILGRKTASTGAVEELSADDVYDILNLTGHYMVFGESTPPTGWTQYTGWNDLLMRFVSGAGGGTGGSWTISGLTAASHTHSVSGSCSASGSSSTSGPSSSDNVNQGSGSNLDFATTSHTHSFSVSVSGSISGTAAASGALAVSSDAGWRPAYADCILASKD